LNEKSLELDNPLQICFGKIDHAALQNFKNERFFKTNESEYKEKEIIIIELKAIMKRIRAYLAK